MALKMSTTLAFQSWFIFSLPASCINEWTGKHNAGGYSPHISCWEVAILLSTTFDINGAKFLPYKPPLRTFFWRDEPLRTSAWEATAVRLLRGLCVPRIFPFPARSTTHMPLESMLRTVDFMILKYISLKGVLNEVLLVFFFSVTIVLVS